MNITEKTLSTLEFDKIRAMLASVCPTAGSSDMAYALTPYDRVDQIKRAQRRTTDARRLTDAKGLPSFGGVCDVGDVCERAVKGATLTPRELLDVCAVLRASRMLLDYIRSKEGSPLASVSLRASVVRRCALFIWSTLS